MQRATRRPSRGQLPRLARHLSRSNGSIPTTAAGLRIGFLALVAALVVAAPIAAGDAGAEDSVELSVHRWLVLDPRPAPLPAVPGEREDGTAPTDLIAPVAAGLDDAVPAAGTRVVRADGSTSAWRKRPVEAGALVFEAPAGDSPAVAVAAARLDAERFVEGELVLETGQIAAAFLDGEQVAVRSTAQGTDDAGDEAGRPGDRGSDAAEDGGGTGKARAELALAPGRHLLLVVCVRDPEGPGTWSLSASVRHPAPEGGAPLRVSLEPEGPLSLEALLDRRAVEDLDVSPDGALVAIRYRMPDIAEDSPPGWLEIRRTADGAPVRVLRGDTAWSGFTWAPTGRRMSYVTEEDERGTLWVGDLDEAEARPVLEDVERLGAHAWTPDGRSIVYAVTTPGKEPREGVQRLRGLADRWSDARDTTHLWQVRVEGGARRRLTAGPETTELQDMAPDTSRLLLSVTLHDASFPRPYVRTELHELDLETLRPRKAIEGTWLGDARYGPDGERILVLGGPSAFGDVGQAVSPERVPNEYDTQVYVVDRATGEVTCLTREFAASVESAEWSRAEGAIWLRATEGPTVGIFRLDPQTRDARRIPARVDVVAGWSLARSAPRLVWHGTSAARPTRIVSTDLARPDAGSRPIADPGEESFPHLRLGRVEDFDVRLDDGTVVPGRVHFPPDHDPDRRWPAIVYYYGGTSPVLRSFGGRYPKNLWAAHGYVVYVLQPTGAYGWGQKASSRHVNDWGKTVTREIRAGVDRFLTEHPSVDPGRVGCIGASFGGFITMLLLTETDRFAAAISHAGISSIASYWGEGWWGWLYGAVALAESFPWNRPDIYVERSALFRADRIRTPLLLLHGTADTNVPPGESENLFTALRLLEREVEYLRFEGEGHWILSRTKRRIWAASIIAWFDAHLKDEPGWWEHLYAEREDEDPATE